METRYPGHYEDVTEEDFLKAVQLAETAYRWADSLIPKPSEKDTDGRTPAS